MSVQVRIIGRFGLKLRVIFILLLLLVRPHPDGSVCMEWERLVQARKEVKLDNGQVIYILLTSAAEGVIVKYIIIRPFEIDFFIDNDGLTGTFLEFAYRWIPHRCSQVKQRHRSRLQCHALRPGVKVDTNNDVFAFWDFTSLEAQTNSSHDIFHI